MRRLAPAALIALLTCVAPGCKRQTKAPEAEQPASDRPTELRSAIAMNDGAASAQLVKGFYTIENGSWRWTMRKFSVALKPPQGAAQNGARLNLKFTLPESAFKQMGPTTLTATINGLPLPPETYSKPDNYVYTRDVPPTALPGDAVTVDFTCDKGFTPPGDARDLSLIVVSVGLDPK